jgi:hypothetical protein
MGSLSGPPNLEPGRRRMLDIELLALMIGFFALAFAFAASMDKI